MQYVFHTWTFRNFPKWGPRGPSRSVVVHMGCVRTCETKAPVPRLSAVHDLFYDPWPFLISVRMVVVKLFISLRHGYFRHFLFFWTPKIHLFSPKLRDFYQFYPRKRTRASLSQIIHQNLGKLEMKKEKRSSNPGSRTQQDSISSIPKIKRFLHGICHHVYWILLVYSFLPLAPKISVNFLITLSWLNLRFLELQQIIMNYLFTFSK